jgi:hypothetical protein
VQFGRDQYRKVELRFQQPVRRFQTYIPFGLPNLTSIRLEGWNQKIYGTLPESFFCGAPAVSSLEKIILEGTAISGTIPSACLRDRGDDTALSYLSLHFNKHLEGNIPEALLCGNTAAENLQHLDVGYCKLSGVLPSENCLHSTLELHMFTVCGRTSFYSYL